MTSDTRISCLESGAAVLLSSGERTICRDLAVARWERAKSLGVSVERAVANAEAFPRTDRTVPLSCPPIDHTAVRRVDEIVARQRTCEDAVRQAGIGMVLARRISRVALLHDVLREQLPKVWSTRDPVDAVGIAIVHQPDVTLIDDDLTAMSGLDAAWLIRAYAPHSRLVLFTRGREALGRARGDGFDTRERDSSHDQVRAAVEDALRVKNQFWPAPAGSRMCS